MTLRTWFGPVCLTLVMGLGVLTLSGCENKEEVKPVTPVQDAADKADAAADAAGDAANAAGDAAQEAGDAATDAATEPK